MSQNIANFVFGFLSTAIIIMLLVRIYFMQRDIDCKNQIIKTHGTSYMCIDCYVSREELKQSPKRALRIVPKDPK